MNNFETNGLPDPAELIRQYGPLVWKIVSAYLKNPDDIQECVNDIFCDLYLHGERYDPDKGSYPAFLSVAARNKAIDKYRKNLNRSSGLLSSVSKADSLPVASPDSGSTACRLFPDEFPSPEDMAEKVIQRLDLSRPQPFFSPVEGENLQRHRFTLSQDDVLSLAGACEVEVELQQEGGFTAAETAAGNYDVAAFWVVVIVLISFLVVTLINIVSGRGMNGRRWI